MLIIGILFFLCTKAITHINLTVSVQDRYINNYTRYNITINRQYNPSGIDPPTNDYQNYPILMGSIFQLKFTSDYLLDSSINCQYKNNDIDCTFINNILTIQNMFQQDFKQQYIYLTINNVKNPSTPGFKKIQVNIKQNQNQSSKQQGQTFIIIDRGIFQIYFEPPTIKTRGKMILQLSLKNLIPQTNLNILVDINNSWSPAIINSSLTCKDQMTLTLNPLNCITSNLQIIQINGPFTSYNNNSIKFSIQQIFSPPTIGKGYQILITSRNGTNEIDYCTTNINQLQPDKIQTIVVTSNYKVNLQASVRFNISIKQNNIQNHKIQVIFQSFIRVKSVLHDSNANISQHFVIFFLDNYDKTQQIFNIQIYKMPPSTKPSNVIVKLYDNNNSIYRKGQSNFSALPGQLNFTINSTNLQINKQTNLTFNIDTENQILGTGQIHIYFPKQIQILNPICTSSNSQILNNILECSQNNKILVITKLSSSKIVPGSYQITITGITNPSSTIQTFFKIQTYYDTETEHNFRVDVKENQSYKASPFNIGTFNITPSSYNVNQNNVSYTFQFTNQNKIPPGGGIKVTIPIYVKVNNINQIDGKCQKQIINNNSPFVNTHCNATLIQNNTEILFFNFSSNEIDSKTNIQLNINNTIKNAPSTKKVFGFFIQTQDKDGNAIDRTSNCSLEMTQPDKFSSNSLTRQSQVNSNQTIYTFTLSQQSKFQQNSYVKITIPDQVSFSNQVKCSINQDPILCTPLRKQVTIDVNENYSNNQLKVKIQSIKNSFSQKLTSQFQLQTGIQGLGKYSKQNISGVFNKQPSLFQNIQYKFSTQIFYQPMTLNITFATKSILQDNSYLIFRPIDIGIDDQNKLTCSNYINFTADCNFIQSGGNLLQITAVNFSARNMSFIIQGLISPKNTSPYYSILTSYTNDGYKIDQSKNDIIFKEACNLPCKTCSTTNRSSCLSCYDQNKNVTNKTYYQDNQCLQNCTQGFLEINNNKICYKCDSNCSSCQIQLTYCKTCQTSYYIYRQNNTSTNINISICVQNCPSGFYKNNNTNPLCSKCHQNCQICQDGTNLNCSKCNKDFFFHNNISCLQECPQGFLQNKTFQRCQECDNGCVHCENFKFNCTSCKDTHFLQKIQQSNFCVLNCNEFTNHTIRQCVNCTRPCKSCSTSITNCTSCIQDHFLLRQVCRSDCPEGTFKNFIRGQCSLCPEQCITCTSQSFCLICKPNYVLSNNFCVEEGIINSISENKIIPVPWTIGGLILLLTCLISKYHQKKTFLPGCIYATLSIFQFGAIITLFIMYLKKGLGFNIFLFVLIFGIVSIYVLNIINFVLYILRIKNDIKYKMWKQQKKSNKLVDKITIIISLIIFFKYNNIIYSAIFNFEIFKAKLKSPSILSPFNFISFASIILISLPIIIIASYLAYVQQTVNQFFIACIDAIVLLLLNLIFAIANSSKSDDFFQQKLPRKFNYQKANNEQSMDMDNDQKNYQKKQKELNIFKTNREQKMKQINSGLIKKSKRRRTDDEEDLEYAKFNNDMKKINKNQEFKEDTLILNQQKIINKPEITEDEIQYLQNLNKELQKNQGAQKKQQRIRNEDLKKGKEISKKKQNKQNLKKNKLKLNNDANIQKQLNQQDLEHYKLQEQMNNDDQNQQREQNIFKANKNNDKFLKIKNKKINQQFSIEQYEDDKNIQDQKHKELNNKKYRNQKEQGKNSQLQLFTQDLKKNNSMIQNNMVHALNVNQNPQLFQQDSNQSLSYKNKQFFDDDGNYKNENDMTILKKNFFMPKQSKRKDLLNQKQNPLNKNNEFWTNQNNYEQGMSIPQNKFTSNYPIQTNNKNTIQNTSSSQSEFEYYKKYKENNKSTRNNNLQKTINNFYQQNQEHIQKIKQEQQQNNSEVIYQGSQKSYNIEFQRVKIQPKQQINENILSQISKFNLNMQTNNNFMNLNMPQKSKILENYDSKEFIPSNNIYFFNNSNQQLIQSKMSSFKQINKIILEQEEQYMPKVNKSKDINSIGLMKKKHLISNFKKKKSLDLEFNQRDVEGLQVQKQEYEQPKTIIKKKRRLKDLQKIYLQRLPNYKQK